MCGHLLEYTNEMPRDVFIETGTLRGDTIAMAKDHFAYCHSIEFSLQWFNFASDRFRTQQNVRLHYGHSPDILKHIIQFDKPTTFWLDAHWFPYAGPREDFCFPECPLLDELRVIISKPWTAKHLILIDDAHLFIDYFQNLWEQHGKVFRPDEWPTLGQITDLMTGYEMSVANDHIKFVPKGF